MSQIQPYGAAGVPAGPPGPPAGYPAPGYPHGAATMTDRQEVSGAVLAIAWVLAVVTVGYMLPWAVAATRGRANHGAIALINALLGWSVLGWIAALVMACQAHQVFVPAAPLTVVVAQQFPQAQFSGGPPAPHVSVPAGWYPAPDGRGNQYWDGATWTAYRA